MPRNSRSPRGLFVNGDVLRFLRESRGYSQEESASLAGLSERLVRKAESGGPLQSESIRSLADLYEQPLELVVAPSNLIPAQTYSEQSRPVELLRRLLAAIWVDPARFDVANAFTEQLVAYCEEGRLIGREQWIQRWNQQRTQTSRSMLQIHQIGGDEWFATSRWRLLSTPNPPAKRAVVRHANTTIHVARDWIVEIWEFFAP